MFDVISMIKMALADKDVTLLETARELFNGVLSDEEFELLVRSVNG